MRVFSRLFQSQKPASPRHHRPDFMIIGGMKCGTSSLGWNLNRHPSIFLANRGGEVHFFTSHQNFDKGIDWYLGHFPEQEGILKYGDKTPGYIDIHNHQRIHDTFPEVKLIVILRDPVRRFQSHYNYMQRESVPEHHRAAHSREFRIEYLEDKSIDWRIWERGLYVEQLESLFSLYPRDQVHVCFLEDFKEQEQAEYDRIYNFLGVPRWIIEAVPINVQKSYAYPFSTEVLCQLHELYKPYNERLFQLLSTHRPQWGKFAYKPPSAAKATGSVGAGPLQQGADKDTQDHE